MLDKYSYFITLAEEENIVKAAEKLFVSHQCLSKYLKRLEKEYNATFFDRNPRLSITPAGMAYLETVRQVRDLHDNLVDQLANIQDSKKGILRFGTTEARYRILVPAFVPKYKKLYPDVTLETRYGSTAELCDAILNNKLDVALLNQSAKAHNQLDMRPVLEEKLYLVISDEMLQQYFPETWPYCKYTFRRGINLKDFNHVPFVFSSKKANMAKQVLEPYLQFYQIELSNVAEIEQSDLQYMLTAQSYAASFCWSMYIPTILRENKTGEYDHLNIYPINDPLGRNRLMMVTRKGKYFQEYGKKFMKMVKNTCITYSEMELDDD